MLPQKREEVVINPPNDNLPPSVEYINNIYIGDKFNVIRTSTGLEVNYNGERFMTVVSTTPLTDLDIKRILLKADIMDYLGIMDCCEILDEIGLDNYYEI